MSEPSWPAGPRAIVTDNTCTWTEDGPTKVVIEGNIIDNWGGPGPQVNSGGHNFGWVVRNNLIENGGGEGMLVANGSQSFQIEQNKFTKNALNGLDINGASNRVENNVFSFNGGSGACAIDRDGAIIFTSASAAPNGASGNMFASNLFYKNNTHGLRIENAGATLSNTNVTGNAAIGNGTCGRGGDGIILKMATGSGTVENNNISGNVSIGNGRYGVSLVAGGSGTYSNNTLGPNTVGGNRTKDEFIDNPNSENRTTFPCQGVHPKSSPPH